MESKAKLFGHPIHPMLIPLPIGLLSAAAVFDLLYALAGKRRLATAAYFTLVSGIVGGVLAAPFGLIDWLAVPAGTRAKRVGLLHGGGNAVVLVLAIVSWLLRRDRPERPGAGAVAASVGGAGLATVTGWLGGELVDRLGVGVDEGAHIDSPSSLSGQPARVDADQSSDRAAALVGA